MWCSIIFAAVEVYLKINKLWKRKHERVVAESQSIMAETLSIVSAMPLLLLYAFEKQYEGVAEIMIWLPVNFLVILIGAGFWVRGEGARGLWQLIKSSVRAERSEVGDLAKSFFKPAGSEKIIGILNRIAMIDNNLDEKEKEFIRTFAQSWGIHFSEENFRHEEEYDKHWNIIALRDSVIAYLSISPPAEQVKQLRDTIRALVDIDDVVAPEEELVVSEISGMLMHYADKGGKTTLYDVYIAPQSDDKEQLVRRFLPRAERKRSAGGYGFLVDSFYSEDYAEVICNKYREFELLTFVIKRTLKIG